MARPKKAAASPRAASPAPVTTRRRASSKSAATAAPATPRASTPAKLATPANKSASTPRAATPAKPTTPPAAAKTTSKVATPRAATPRAATPAKAVKAATTPRPPFVSAYESPAAVVSSAPAPASLAFGWYSPLIVYTVLSFIAFACFLYEAGHEQTYAVKCAFLVNLFVCVALALFLLPPIPQSLAYHNFADQRQLCCGVPNTFDVSVRSWLFFVICHGVTNLHNHSAERIMTKHFSFSLSLARLSEQPAVPAVWLAGRVRHGAAGATVSDQVGARRGGPSVWRRRAERVGGVSRQHRAHGVVDLLCRMHADGCVRCIFHFRFSPSLHLSVDLLFFHLHLYRPIHTLSPLVSQRSAAPTTTGARRMRAWCGTDCP